jgi:hypothetical protein
MDDAGKIASTTTLSVPRGTPTTIGLDCLKGACRIGLGVAVGERAEIDTARFTPGTASSASRMVGLAGSATMSLSFEVLEDGIVTLDRAGDEGRVRQVLVDWAK